MSPVDPLAALKPLREPELIGWWPMAPGWWILGGLVLLGLLYLAYRLAVRHRDNAYRRQALRQLYVLRLLYRNHRDPREYLAGVNALLKTVAMTAYPDRRPAPHSGNSWREFLNTSAGSAQPFPDAYFQAPYQHKYPDVDIPQVQRAAEHWVKKHVVRP